MVDSEFLVARGYCRVLEPVDATLHRCRLPHSGRRPSFLPLGIKGSDLAHCAGHPS